MTEARSDYKVALCTRELGEADLGRCVTIIRSGGAVDVDSTKLRAATALALAKNGDEIVGVGSMKPVRTAYATGIAKKSGFEFPSETQDLGYVAVDAPHKGKGLSHRLVAELLRGQKGRLFATTDDRLMKRTLSAAGLSRKDMNGRAEGGNFPCECGPERILVKPDSRREFTSDLDAVTKPPPSRYIGRDSKWHYG